MARQDTDKLQSIIATIEVQRNSAFNQVAQMQVLLDDANATIAELKEENENLELPQTKNKKDRAA